MKLLKKDRKVSFKFNTLPSESIAAKITAEVLRVMRLAKLTRVVRLVAQARPLWLLVRG